jgi:quinoprotein glucose dehydrogenase
MDGQGERAAQLDEALLVLERWAPPTSPPTVVNGVAVIGHYVVENQSTDVPPGLIRGYDATTGAFRWAFDPGRPDDHGQPPPGTSYTPSTPNSWTIASGDDALGLVYVSMGMARPTSAAVGAHPAYPASARRWSR